MRKEVSFCEVYPRGIDNNLSFGMTFAFSKQVSCLICSLPLCEVARIDCAVHLTNGERKPEQLNNMLEITEKFTGAKPNTSSLYLGT